jgi:hypothetical protein
MHILSVAKILLRISGDICLLSASPQGFAHSHYREIFDPHPNFQQGVAKKKYFTLDA